MVTEMFGTMTADLLALHEWLQAYGVTQVALESTGVYWDHRLVPFEGTLPGVNRIGAITIVAETGGDMTRFPTAGHLCSWGAMCPGRTRVPANAAAVRPDRATSTCAAR